MFLKKVPIKQEGKTYNYFKIVASYRDKDGKPKHRLIQYLGVLSEVDAERMRLILKAQQDPDLVLAKTSDIVVTKHWLFLHIILLHSLWETFQLQQFFPDGLLIEAMVLNRCIEPLSKINVVEWMQTTVLPAVFGSPQLPDNFAVYRGNWISLTNRKTLYKPISIISLNVLILVLAKDFSMTLRLLIWKAVNA